MFCQKHMFCIPIQVCLYLLAHPPTRGSGPSAHPPTCGSPCAFEPPSLRQFSVATLAWVELYMD